MTITSSPLGIAAVIFDMDGTLLDTEPLYRQAIFAACTELGFEMTDQLHSAQVGIPTDGARALLLDAFGPDFPFDRFLMRMHQIMAELELAQGVEHKKGARDLLALLNERSIPAAVVTSTTRPAAPERLARAGLLDMFDVVITRSDTNRGKPYPEPFLVAAARLGVAPEDCLALEDSPNGIRAATAAGMMAVMVPDLIRPTSEIAALCHAVHDDLNAVRAAYFPEAA